jgi:D-inositol-3-phosphate glycosyltransferase
MPRRMVLCTDRSKRLSIVIIGQYVPSSGLTSVLQSLIADLKGDCDISLIGLGYRGPPFDNGAKIYPDLLTGREPGGRNPELEALLEAANADVIFLFNDISVQVGYLEQVRSSAPDRKIVTYTTVDALILDDMLSGLSAADRCVFPCEFARAQAEKALPSSNLAVIPLGVDTERFCPRKGSVEAQFLGNRRQHARRALFPDDPDFLDAFIVLNGNRPWLRKRIDLTIKGFAIFARHKPANVKLFLHHARTDERERASILKIAKRLGILDRLILNPIVEGKSEVSVERLNLLYNACDVGINTAMGEGWGLVSFEHAATGAAQIVPKHSACAEIWEGAAELLEPVERDVYHFAPYCEYQTIAPEDVAERLERLYSNTEHQRDMAISAYRRVTLPQYAWQNIAEQWKELFRSVVET